MPASGVSDSVGDRLHAAERRALCDPREVRVGLPVRDKPAEERVGALPVRLREDVRVVLSVCN